MKFIVDVKDISYGTVEVEADSVEQAEEKAQGRSASVSKSSLPKNCCNQQLPGRESSLPVST